MAKNAKQQAAIAMSMKAAGKKPKMAKGGTMKKYGDGGKVTSDENVTTYNVKVFNFHKMKFDKSNLMDNYKQEFKKRMYGKENG